ncbi:MAG TPA: type I-B CRISPR-associated protein Cas7/Cst2/DevR, partial [Aquifex aeolicus]|nr:type I-B CRISPR-associated protein Cas7/Cst2/DevR [Aquifex aeolicus]
MSGLTLTIITSEASSLNYGENIGNVSVLKKVSLGNGEQITYVSDKALKYDIKRKGKEEKNWKLLDKTLQEYIKGNLKNGKLDVDSFGKQLVKEYEEFDLFGGLFTNLKLDKKVELSYGDSVKRTSPVKITYAFSLAPFKGDMNFLNNIDAFNRYIKHIE